VVATLVAHPEYIYHNEQLSPDNFSNTSNANYFAGISFLAKQEVPKIDAYNLTIAMNKLNISPVPSAFELNEFLDSAAFVARGSVEEYKLLCDSVLDKSFRRELLRKLKSCEGLCGNKDITDVQTKVYDSLDSVIMDYSAAKEVVQFKENVDGLWSEIVMRRDPKHAGFDSFISELNKYLDMSRGSLTFYGAKSKGGKSMMLMDLAIYQLRQGKSILYIDSELNDATSLLRMVSHVSQVEYRKVKSGRLSPEEEDKIKTALDEIKTWKLVRQCCPVIDEKMIYALTKKAYHAHHIDILVLDYLKSSRSGDAYATYSELGRISDVCKNLANTLDIAVLSAVQLTDNLKVSDSKNIERSGDALIYLIPKTKDEIETDGQECGNYKMEIRLNRNGGFHMDGEYIDLEFDGDRCTFRNTKQHAAESPV
jgi:replicative DNA helicase